ncbi:DUF262 domain-containing protein [Vagococcus zengguangii]|uniref:DUF262 domain-containing protein n=1 Tax=Vagococcus zengguangii TaxID=2571750 RepID=A0A4D7CRA9_9ENTE|nr:DUF262 domain-containing protein [Vagococcus zengguangii]QCI86628.1 DUF262 domain-containing protein [Vagococcus zengguangii]
MVETVTIGVNVINREEFTEQIDVRFVKETNDIEEYKYYNLENEYLSKRDITISLDKEKSQVFNVDIEFSENIVDSAEEIRLEFTKSYNDKLYKLQSQDEEEDIEEVDNEIKPYDPTLIRVDQKLFTIESTVEKIMKKSIDLNPEFQRKFVWTDITRKSRLIESVMLRIPLPVFYLSEDEDGIYHVLDGLQRLSVLNSYLNNGFRLKNLEYLEEECGGKFFQPLSEDEDERKAEYEKNPNKYLPQKYVRRINDTMLNFNVVDSRTPDQAKYDIFRRINTGGKPLNRQEMRNAMATPHTRQLLKSLSDLEIFKKATAYSVKDTRFADQELILRFIGFYLIDNEYKHSVQYKGAMANFLDQVIENLNKYYSNREKFQNDIFQAFKRSMENSYELFGDKGFKRTTVINKALFLSVSRNAYRYELINDYNAEQNVELRDLFFNYNYELNDDNNTFWIGKVEKLELKSRTIDDSLSTGTNEILKIESAYTIMAEILEVLINESN